MTFAAAICAPLLVLSNQSALLAHHEPATAGGWLAGVTHPLLGVDHLLAMLAVGLLAATMTGRVRWALPTAFVVGMLGGAGFALAGVALHGVELGIAASVVALGVALCTAWRLPTVLTITLIAGVGALHGHAHGSEMPALAQPALYAAGFLLSTVGLHLLGAFGGGLVIAQFRRTEPLRWIGGAVAMAGCALVFGILS